MITMDIHKIIGYTSRKLYIHYFENFSELAFFIAKSKKYWS